ncbi:MAG: RidA family protein [Oscillospiraceae bacterium]
MSSSSMPIPQGNYRPATRFGDLIYTSGMTPRDHGVLTMTGKVSAAQPLESYRDAVRLATGNALIAARSQLAENEHIAGAVSLTVYIAAESDFTTHPKLADFASEYLCEELGAAGVASRAAIGVATLPGNAPIEIQLIAAVSSK